MKFEEVEQKIKSYALKNFVFTFLGIILALLFFSQDDQFPIVGSIGGLLGTLVVSYKVYSINSEAHYKLSRYAPELYRTELDKMLADRGIGRLVFSNWFVKTEERLRHNFKNDLS